MRFLLASAFLLLPHIAQLAHAEAFNQPKVHVDPALRLYDSAGVTQAANLPDGGVVLVGDFDEYAGVRVDGIVKLFPDGSVDLSFKPSLEMQDIGPAHPNGVALVGDDLYVSGAFNLVDGVETVEIARFQLPELSLTPNSISASAQIDAIRDIDGDLLVAAGSWISRFDLDNDGSLTQWNDIQLPQGTYGTTALKISPEGNIGVLTVAMRILVYSGSTGGFLFEAPVPTPGWNFGLQFDFASDGDLLISGDFHVMETTGPANLIRVDGSTGQVVPTWTFHSDDPDAAFGGVLALPDGGAIVTGGFTQINDTPTPEGIARIDEDGTVRPHWGNTHASVKSEFLHALGNGLFLIGEKPIDGGACTVQFARIQDGANLPPVPAGSVLSKDASIRQILGDSGDVFVGGQMTRTAGFSTDGVLKLDRTLTIDESFSAQLVGHFFDPPAIRKFAVGGGHLYALGSLPTFESSDDPEEPYWIFDHHISSLTGQEWAPGSYDNQPSMFGFRTVPTYNPTDGAFYLVQAYGGQTLPYRTAFRYLPEARATDPAWMLNVANLTYTRTSVVVGDHLYYGGYRTWLPPLNGIIGRIRISDGTADTAWNPPYRPRISTLVVDANQEWIYVGGGDSTFNGLSRISVSTGLVDPDWKPLAALPTDNVWINTIAIDDGGNIYVGGRFRGASCDPGHVVDALRLIGGNVIDPTWHLSTDIEYFGILSILDADDGRVVVGGNFQTINGVFSPGFAIVDSTTDVIFMDQIGDTMCIP